MNKIYLLTIFIAITSIVTAQNVGIGTTTPTAQLHTTGTVRHAALSGVGIRPVLVDANGNLLATVPSLPASSSTNNTAQGIPDISCTGVSSTNSLSGLPASVQSASIAVTINITHPRLADLSIYLTAPGGSIINLLSPAAAASGGNLTNTVFTDAGASLSSGTAPFTGQFKPYAETTPSICGVTPTVASFGVIGGGTINPNGTWTLKVIDNTTGNTGTLKNWTVSVVSGLGTDGVWGLKGNSGTNDFNFIGTTDRAALRFKVNNSPAGLIDTLGNTYFGSYSGSFPGIINKGISNTGVGEGSLQENITGQHNTAVGSASLLLNSTGNYNTAVGDGAMLINSSGNMNTAVGHYALLVNQTGNYNTAIGDSALFNNAIGMSNVAIGAGTLSSDTVGSANIAIGTNANVARDNLNNAIAIGYNATVDASNKVRLGNTAITVIEGQVPFSSPSDGRFKTNITETVKGLDFITRLRPVVYNFQTKKYEEFLRKDMPNQARYASQDFSESENIRHSGFVAQEVEKAAKDARYDFNGIIAPKNDKETYGLAYSQFVVPLVKAVQEQQAIIEEQNKKIDVQQRQINTLLAEMQIVKDKLK